MPRKLLLWRWSQDYDTPSKRKKRALTFRDITSRFTRTGDHPAIGESDIAAFRKAMDQAFGADENTRHFVFHQHDKCAVVSYSDTVRIALVPKIASIGRRFGLNASEF